MSQVSTDSFTFCDGLTNAAIVVFNSFQSFQVSQQIAFELCKDIGIVFLRSSG
jgi:hypothetical protein